MSAAGPSQGANSGPTDVDERPLVFACADDTLVGVATLPARATRIGVGIVIVVGGPQYRAGSHRVFVLLARRLAAAGYAVLRFDYRGMGDASGATRSFEDVDEDIAAAVAALRSASGAERIVLWGLCDGASAALMYCAPQRDPAIAGLVLVNPWTRSETSHARVQLRHYYGARVASRAFWTRLARGGVDVRQAARDVAARVRALAAPRPAGAGEPFQARMARALRAFAGPVLVVISERDLTAREFLDHACTDAAWLGLLERPNVRRRDIEGADHTFSSPAALAALQAVMLDWLPGCAR